jgi:FemAB-related protein (PEP-CTERM system-associated)
LAALLSFYFKDQVMPYYGGAVPAARPSHAYDLLYWSLMRRAVGRGARVFDFGRSKVGSGAFDYKRFWGFEPTPLAYQYCLVRARTVPDVNPLNPKYRHMVAIWRRLPLPVANRLGPLLARQLG